jgi:putative aldouronate transport system substrate-binding protein
MKRAIIAVACLALAVSSFAQAKANKEKMDISIAMFSGSIDYFGSRGKDEVLKRIEDKFNVNFVYKPITWSNYKEKLNLWAAAGELPDYFPDAITGISQYDEWVDQGIVKPLPKDLGKYPNIKALVSQSKYASFMRDGRYWMIPRENGGPHNEGGAAQYALYVRKDWREKLGIAKPTNFAEYKAMLKAFVEKDPDGDGKADTQGMVPRESSWGMDAAFFPLAPKNFGGWTKSGGKWIPSGYTKEYRAAVIKAGELMNAGLIDRDYLTFQNTQEPVDRFTQGREGVLASQPLPGAIQYIYESWQKFNPNKDFFSCVEILDTYPWAYTDGTRYRFETIGFWAENYFAGTISDAKMDRILQICDYLLGPEGSALWLYGIDGKTYRIDNGKYVDLREKDEKGKPTLLSAIYPSTSYFGRMVGWALENMPWDNPLYEITYGKDIMKMANGYMNKLLKDTKPMGLNFALQYIMTPMQGKISKIEANQVIVDSNPAARYDALYAAAEKAGLDKWIDEVNAEAAKQGIK